ncbi:MULTISPECIES: malonate decarboxylase subunit epsilon [unclassified Polaromonas]|uniref:malonate decarboxylase subunit epsilon n=1 Tax=unclassified Polaromonas TaxID=2638319 RepID=UPI0018CB5974|nr:MULTISPECIES: malonate decarboxylase subunit epsilon [unclassified Polaromonas]MBG6071644.1 malonate decarboxylase epsilon subunit [Polaromonas sp. CG_9.7]MBG6113645.1 malonate decarboxylase epsilon subunit [Polaromonas sp. CG_9.2]MDH6184457.1 malonate decarboxylase epsilon subunit [Polaromonas sp. CG_23.6]
MSILFTFPGQGAQRAGMLHALPHNALVREVMDEASEVLGRDALALDSDAALRSSVAVQLALLIAGVATARHLIREAGPPDAVAGLSVGAYPAAVVASVLSYANALRLVERRARLMEAAYPCGYGMTAILGLERAALEPLIAQVHSAVSPVFLANVNAPTQLVVAGAHAAMAHVAELAQKRGAYAAKPVAISVPSHCPLLDAPAAELALAMAAVPVAAPRLRYFSASLGRALSAPALIADDLARNMALPVKWHDTSVLAHEHGVRLSVEMPPGSVLTKLGGLAFPDAVSVAAAGTRTDTLAVLMARERQREQ